MSRRNNRELKKIDVKLSGYLNYFYSICYFDEKALDWNILSEKEYQRLKGKWKAFCKQKQYTPEIIATFQWSCLLLKTRLILQTKYKSDVKDDIDKNLLLDWLQKGMKPIEVADKAKKELTLKELP